MPQCIFIKIDVFVRNTFAQFSFDAVANGRTRSRSNNAEQDSNDEPARITARHQELGDRPGQQADDDPADHAIILKEPCHPAFLVYSSLPLVRTDAPTRACGASAAVSRKRLAFKRRPTRLLRKVTY